MTKIIIKAAQLRREGKTLDSLIADLQEAKEEKELRFPITAADFRPVGEKLIADPRGHRRLCVRTGATWRLRAVAPDNREGIRISFPAGEGDGDYWFPRHCCA